jgi:hypothetical protein
MGRRSGSSGNRSDARQMRGRREPETSPRRPIGDVGIRIGRHVTKRTVDDVGWDEYSKELRRRNTPHLTVLDTASMFCSLVPGRLLSAALEEKYPHAYKTEKGARDLHVKMSRGYAQFVKDSLQAVREFETDYLLSEDPDRYPGSVPLTVPETSGSNMWAHVDVKTTKGLFFAGTHSVVLALNENPFLDDETEETLKWLTDDEGLSNRILRPKVPGRQMLEQRPKKHLTIIRSSGAQINPALLDIPNYLEHPSYITLAGPEVLSNVLNRADEQQPVHHL